MERGAWTEEGCREAEDEEEAETGPIDGREEERAMTDNLEAVLGMDMGGG